MANDHHSGNPAWREEDVWSPGILEQVSAVATHEMVGDYEGHSILVPELVPAEHASEARDKNAYEMQVASRTKMTDVFVRIRSAIERVFRFSADSHYHDLSYFLANLVGSYFASDVDYSFRAFSLNRLRLRVAARSSEDRRLKFAHSGLKYRYLPGEPSELDMGIGVIVPLAGVLWEYDPAWSDERIRTFTSIARIEHHRRLLSPFVERYSEITYCRAMEWCDDPWLSKPCPPATIAIEGAGNPLGTTCVLGLHRALLRHGDIENSTCDTLMLELAPATGRVVAIRSARSTFKASFARMAIENHGLAHAVRRRGW